MTTRPVRPQKSHPDRIDHYVSKVSAMDPEARPIEFEVS